MDPDRPARLPTDVLVFDGECSFCTGIARWVERRLPAGTGVVPWQRFPDPAAYGLTERELAAAAYWIDARGRPHRGHLAFSRALLRVGGMWGVIGDLIELPPMSWLARVAYEIVTRNRHRLPGPVPACRDGLP